ncbi:acetolactate synthase large subunit [Streptococcus agalactiae]|uniref:acetolactate synthase AlsS n=1 Tax=Streptococcus agalactiae TaxID=1311 RepID=UPI0008D932FE|nr:acetolactate synthase AlsS [Streptococcus agalactiae]OHX69808.1 acetolactate synthase large subunit [Streptococcus agalactiae]OHX70452.1 acetolactate synthase large subunit [Streptococcus agalactiae]OHX75758.1 acetolactate synthase large subunit [Streptococcus agalactiae]OHX76736.1 acetolactate synthase large subunit [Streptococcus agalactiae]OHX80029.1 acetolactate synthase large subunit [Streptococcus agalactiae]
MTESHNQYGADLIVDSLINHDVKYVFGIPGAKIDRVFDTLEDKGPELIVARHEQNATFMAQAVGRITGEPGVVIATSGPGISNLATGLVTATDEGDAVLAIGGQVKRGDLLKRAHQSMNNVAMLEPITKYSAEVHDPNTLSETVANAYRLAKSGKPGASFISIPQDVTDSPVSVKAIKPLSAPKLGSASVLDINYLAQAINNAVLPVLLLGNGASSEGVTAAVRRLLDAVKLPVVETFQGAGIVSRELEDETFFGRVGLFRNQPGDMLLKRADLVIAIGYDPIEYEARNWNAEISARIIVIDVEQAEIDTYFQPERELIGDMAHTLDLLLPAIKGYELPEGSKEYLKGLRNNIENVSDVKFDRDSAHGLVHPLDLIDVLQENTTDDMTVTVDVGSHYIWMARYFKSYEARHLLFSNGMQTLGVALPWAISAALLRPNTKVISVSGDGGFLFSAQELETAVRLHLPIVHIIWNDGKYNMVEFQEEMKYGRSSGVDFGPVDFVKYAESFGAKGYRVDSKGSFEETLKQALIDAENGPVLIDVPIDYKDNVTLGETILPDEFY